jgi:hypothetical protein
LLEERIFPAIEASSDSQGGSNSPQIQPLAASCARRQPHPSRQKDKGQDAEGKYCYYRSSLPTRLARNGMNHGTFTHSQNSTEEEWRGEGGNQTSSATTPLSSK